MMIPDLRYTAQPRSFSAGRFTPNVFYSVLRPGSWLGRSPALTFCATFAGCTSLQPGVVKVALKFLSTPGNENTSSLSGETNLDADASSTAKVA